MKNNPFPPELRTAAFVSRWNIMWSNIRSDIAQHSFFAAWYSYMITKVIKWRGPVDYLLLSALAHDLGETITADLIGPAKKHIIDEEKATAWIESKMAERMGQLWVEYCVAENNMSDKVFEDVEKITKAADLLDAVLHLKVEKRLGNTCTEYADKILMAQLESKWRELPADPDMLSETWQTVVLPAIRAHETEGGKGV